MSRCALTRGFLTLRECGQPAVAVCSACGRPACVEHLAVAAPEPLCIECSAARSDWSGSDDSRRDWDSGSSTWHSSYREDYYRQTGYSPPSTDGFRTGGTFDDLDKEAFDPTLAAAGLLAEEDVGPGLFDS